MCTLCGNTDHRAVEGCKFMRTDQGKQVTVIPTSLPCRKCPSNVKPMRHPEKFCPYRPKGPLANVNPDNIKKD